MTRQCLCAPTGNARSHNSIFLNAFEAQNLFQNDLDNGGFGLWYWLNVQEEKLQEPMWPMQWPSSSKVARVNLKQKMTGSKNGRRTHLLNLLLKQLSGIPLRDTVVNGTRQSDFERFFGNSCFSSFVLPSASVEELSLYIFPSPSSAYMAAL